MDFEKEEKTDLKKKKLNDSEGNSWTVKDYPGTELEKEKYDWWKVRIQLTCLIPNSVYGYKVEDMIHLYEVSI